MIPYKINSENLLLIFPLLFLGLSKIQAQNISKRADTIRALQNATPQQNQQIQEGTQQNVGPETASTPATGRHNQPVTYQSTNKAAKSNVFGSEFFYTTSLSFEPNLRISTPINYLLGPDDHVIVNVYGNSLANWDLQKRAGGLTPFAYKKGIYLTRRSKNENLNEQVEIVKNIQNTTKDTSAKAIEDITKTNSRIPINFEKLRQIQPGLKIIYY